jgi:hypothetical protein
VAEPAQDLPTSKNHALLPPPDEESIAYVKAIVTSSLYLQTDVPMEDGGHCCICPIDHGL